MTHNSLTSKFVFFGTPHVASGTLEVLHERGYLPQQVVTSPDSPQGRGLVMTPSAAKMWALEHNVPVITPEKVTDEVIEEINKYECTYALVAAYGKILPEALIASFPLGILNVHYSLLPKYRGASPVETALLHGDTVTGVTIQQMVPELDAGDVLASSTVAIEPEETTRELRSRLVVLGANLLADLLPSFEAGTATHTPQDPIQATKCKKIKKEMGQLDMETDTPEMHLENWRKYRAFAESPGTYFFVPKTTAAGVRQLRLKITHASFMDGKFIVERVIPEGKSEQSFADYKKNNQLI